ncbi:MAG: NifU family protein [Chloroflexota bacterium]|nr:NifU family protein [Chloroflexota bacterium]
MAARGRRGRTARADAAQGRNTAMREGCALCGRAARPPALSLTTTTPAGPADLRVVGACRDCAASTATYAALVAALLRAAAPEATAALPATVAPGE